MFGFRAFAVGAKKAHLRARILQCSLPYSCKTKSMIE
jgi:hypothetical protein